MYVQQAEIHDAKKQLNQNLKIFFFKQVYAAPLAEREKVGRIEVSLKNVDPLLWLWQQKASAKTYWSDREQNFEMAGVGEADVVFGQSSIDYSSVFNRLKTYLSESYPNLRYYGGMSFSQTQPLDDSWQAFGYYRFVIPKFEVYRDNIGTRLACNFILKPSGDYPHQLSEILNELEKLDFTTPDEDKVKHLPLVVGRKNFPSRSGWHVNIKKALASFDRGRTEKIVLARKSTFEFAGEIEPLTLLLLLKNHNSHVFNFCFQPREGNAFVAATPERLYHRLQGRIQTEAVAGTRRRGKSSQEDRKLGEELLNSEKDVREHQLVVESLKNILQQMCQLAEINGEMSLLKLKKIQHLCTRFQGILLDNVSDAEMLPMMHPTPAVGGFPRKQALLEIEAIEPFNRGWYAGPVGWIGHNAAEFAVGIRSGLVEGNQLSLFSGAGIVQGSNPEAEWDEIENKISKFVQLFQESDIPKQLDECVGNQLSEVESQKQSDEAEVLPHLRVPVFAS